MTFEERLIVIALAVFATICSAATLAVPLLARRLTEVPPAARASALLRLRLWPGIAAAGAMILAGASFFVFEQREYLESTGVMLPILAGLTLAFWCAGLLRALMLLISTRRLRRTWMASARPITLPDASVPAFAIVSSFPVVAVIGILRPRLMIAESVLSACTEAELGAIVAHENRHVRARDNLRRALIAFAPDCLSLLPLGRRLRRAWNDAAEEAADDAATTVGQHGRLLLAEALVRVARLGAPASSPALPASSLYRGESLDRRVRRLLVPAPATAVDRAVWWRRLLPFVAFAIACGFALEAVHVVVELAVTFLP